MIIEHWSSFLTHDDSKSKALYISAKGFAIYVRETCLALKSKSLTVLRNIQAFESHWIALVSVDKFSDCPVTALLQHKA
jgi:hypothetical protein